MALAKPWFRIHNTIVDNPKIQRLPDNLVRPWLNLMATANKNGGLLPPIDEVAFALRTTETKIETLLETFQKRRLFDLTERGWEPHDWNDWQYQSDVSTPRVKRFRDKKRNVSETADETDQRQSRDRAEDTHPSGVSARAKPTKGTRLAADWKPSEEIYAHGAALNLTTDEITGLCRAFFEHFHNNPDCAKPVKKDWNRACKRWITTDAPRIIANRNRAGRAGASQRSAGSVLSALGKILDASDGNAGGMGETFAHQEVQPGATETAHTTSGGPENSEEFGNGDVIDGEWDRVSETSGGIEVPHSSEGGTHGRYRGANRDLCTADREIPGGCMEVRAGESAGSQPMVSVMAGTEGTSGSVRKSAATASEASDDLTLPTFLDRSKWVNGKPPSNGLVREKVA